MTVTVFHFFFFQAEDGIRDLTVTGVQTCALPICTRSARRRRHGETSTAGGSTSRRAPRKTPRARDRSDRGLPRPAREGAVRVVDRGDPRRGPEGKATDVRHAAAVGRPAAAVPDPPPPRAGGAGGRRRAQRPGRPRAR